MIITIQKLNEKFNSILKELHPELYGEIKAIGEKDEYFSFGKLRIRVKFKNARRVVELETLMNQIQKYTEVQLDAQLYDYAYRAFKSLLSGKVR